MKPLLLLVLALAACGDDDDVAAIPDAGAPDARVLVATFPAGFLWGTGNAPYQVEGGLHGTDWFAWEGCARCSADHADDGPDFWNRYDADFALAQGGGHNTIRIGIDWSRVFPDGMDAPADADAVARYHQILAAARARGLAPMVTLHHFATPTWLAGGWLDPTAAARFAAWARFCAGEFGAEVDWWITINEPIVYVLSGYLSGDFPPGNVADVPGALAVVDAMLAGHAQAYDAIHDADDGDADGDGRAARVSIAGHQRVFRGLNPGTDDDRAALVLASIANRAFFDALVLGRRDLNFDLDFDDEGEQGLEELAGRLDFLGVNYYGISLVQSFGPSAPPPLVGLPMMNDLADVGFDAPETDFGWSIYPQGFTQVLEELRPYGLPVVITENGLADADDNQRPRFLIDHLRAVADAIAGGIDVRGYYHWTLVDNFEWAAGFCPRFGLASFDAGSPERTRSPRGSLAVYRQIIEAGGISAQLVAQYPSYPAPGLSCPRTGM